MKPVTTEEIIKAQELCPSDYVVVKNFYEPDEWELSRLKLFLADCLDVLDLGCGNGKLITTLSKLTNKPTYLGVDTKFLWDEKPKENSKLKFEFGSPDTILMSGHRFDAVICCWPPADCNWLEKVVLLSRKKIVWVEGEDYATGGAHQTFSLAIKGFQKTDAWKSKAKLNSRVELWKRL